MRPDTAIGALWLLWFLSWLAAAGWTAATRTQQAGGQRLQHGVFLWAGAFFLFSRPDALAPLLHPLYPEGRGLGWAAVFVAVFGLGWTWWARVHLGRLWSANVALKEGHAIVRSGPYRVTRHPIYTGLLLALLATAVQRDSTAALLGLVLCAAGLVIKVRQEEQLLGSAFGAEYAAYRAAVPALVPRPW